MEDDKSLALSLGLACGRSSSPSKDNSANSVDGRTDTDERTSKILSDFRHFLNAGVPQPSQQITSGENDFCNRVADIENKRKSTFADMKNHKKHQSDSHSSDLQVKGKNSHISITTDEGSTGDNEHVAESEAEGSTPGGSACSSQAPEEMDGKSNINASSFPEKTADTSTLPCSITIKDSLSESSPSTPVHPLSMHSVTTNGGHPTSVSLQATNRNSSDVRPLVVAGAGSGEEGSPSQQEVDIVAQSNSSFPSEYPTIRPGIAAEVYFGGSGSSPNLPWVSTTGRGPNGKTISGVTYKYNATQIKIVCACHGIHLSPAEFIQHATREQPSVVMSASLASLQSSHLTVTSAMS